MTIGIAYHKGLAETQLSGLIRNHAGRDKVGSAALQLTSRGVGASCQQNRLPVNDVACLFVRGNRPSVARCQILQQFDPRSASAPQCRNAQVSAKHVVQVLLLGSVVLALSGHMQAEQVAVELNAGFGIPHHNCGMVDAEKELVASAVPLLRPLIGRKLQHLNRMPIWILEVERRDARRVLVPIRKALWS